MQFKMDIPPSTLHRGVVKIGVDEAAHRPASVVLEMGEDAGRETYQRTGTRKAGGDHDE